MKKTYQQPAILIVALRKVLPICTSLKIDSSSENRLTEDGDFLVKKNDHHFNVWDDDWSD